MGTKKQTKPLRLFVWDGFCPDYSEGLAFAVARTEASARRMVERNLGYSPADWGDLSVYPLLRPVARAISGGS